MQKIQTASRYTSSKVRIRNHNYRPTSHMDPLFSTRFPAPARRSLPVASDPFDEISSSSVTFRHADATSRALNALARTKYDRMERRRASYLLSTLLLLALSVHFASNGAYYVGFAMSKIKKGDGEIETEKEEVKEEVVAEKSIEDIKKNMEEEEKEKKKLEQMAFLNQYGNLEDYSAVASTTSDPTRTMLFWHIPRSGGSTIKGIMGQCFGLTGATEAGKTENQEEVSLAIIDVQGVKYVNVDTYTLEGISHANYMGFASAGLADVVVSSYLLAASQNLFDEEHKGRAFTLLRHPIDRAVSMYYYQKEIGAVPDDINIEQYAQGQGIENNWMTRYLVNVMEGELVKAHLEQAKIILFQKFLIGFLDDMEESLARFIKYSGWKFTDEDQLMGQELCINNLVDSGMNQVTEPYPRPKKGSQAYALISWQTQYDIKLYEYAKVLFTSQTKAWGTKERKKADKKKRKQAKESILSE